MKGNDKEDFGKMCFPMFRRGMTKRFHHEDSVRFVRLPQVISPDAFENPFSLSLRAA
jgi:hypothetical protein